VKGWKIGTLTASFLEKQIGEKGGREIENCRKWRENREKILDSFNNVLDNEPKLKGKK
jgi:hypothetical protein